MNVVNLASCALIALACLCTGTLVGMPWWAAILFGVFFGANGFVIGGYLLDTRNHPRSSYPLTMLAIFALILLVVTVWMLANDVEVGTS